MTRRDLLKRMGGVVALAVIPFQLTKPKRIDPPSVKSEKFWRGAQPGMSFELDPKAIDEILGIDKEMREEIEKYFQNIRRYLSIEGIEIK